MTDLLNAIGKSLQRLRLEHDALKREGVAIVVKRSEDGQDAALLVPAGAGIDTLEVKTVNSRGLKLSTEPPQTVDLGGLGEWAAFPIAGFEQAPHAVVPGATQPASVVLVGKDAAGGEVFRTVMGLAQVLDVVRGKDATPLIHGPLPAGTRDGVTFVQVDAIGREWLETALKRPLGQLATSDEVRTAWAKHLATNSAAQGAIGALLNLGVLGAPAEPRVAAQAPAAAADTGPLSAAAVEWLGRQGKDVPSLDDADAWKALLSWARGVNDRPTDLVGELRQGWRAAQDAAAAAEAEFNALAGLDSAAPTVTPIDTGAASVAAQRAHRRAQVQQALAPLALGRATLDRLADVVQRAAQQPAARPTAIIIAGPAATAADHMMTVARAIAVGKLMEIGGAHLSDSMLLGHDDGVPGSDALLLPERVEALRTGMRKPGILIDGLERVGSQGEGETPDQKKERLIELGRRLGSIATWLQDGEVRQVHNGSAYVNTPMHDAVVLMRYSGDASELERVLAGSPKLAGLTEWVVPYVSKPAEDIAALEMSVAQRLHDKPNARVVFDAAIRQEIEGLYRAGLPAAVVKERLDPLFDAALRNTPPLANATFTLALNTNELLPEDVTDLFAGLVPDGVRAPITWSVAQDGAPLVAALPHWDDIVAERDHLAARVEQLEDALRESHALLKASAADASATAPAGQKGAVRAPARAKRQ